MNAHQNYFCKKRKLLEIQAAWSQLWEQWALQGFQILKDKYEILYYLCISELAEHKMPHIARVCRLVTVPMWGQFCSDYPEVPDAASSFLHWTWHVLCRVCKWAFFSFAAAISLGDLGMEWGHGGENKALGNCLSGNVLQVLQKRQFLKRTRIREKDTWSVVDDWSGCSNAGVSMKS